MLLTKYTRVNTSSCHPAPWNPGRRCTPSDSRFERLLESIRLHGQQQPVQIFPHPDASMQRRGNFMFIDGHRRWTCCRELKIKQLTALIYKIDLAQAREMYSYINATCAGQSKNDLLGTWLEFPDAVPADVRHYFAKMTRMLGRPMVNRLYKSGSSPYIFDMARIVAIRCGKKDDVKVIATLTEWLMDNPVKQIVRATLSSGLNSQLILRAARQDRLVERASNLRLQLVG